jgi:ABC-type transporter Mla MlaB component
MQYYMHDGSTAFRFTLSGALDIKTTEELERAWRAASTLLGSRLFIVDMSYVTSADAAGRRLLARWYEGGARLIGESSLARALIAEVTGKPCENTEGQSGLQTWIPFRLWAS